MKIYYANDIFHKISSVSEARELFPVTNSCVYLDSAHYSPYSLEVNKRLADFINEFTFTNKNLSLFNIDMSKTLKEKIARLINSDSEDIILTSSTTHGINIFASGVKLEPGDSVAYPDSEFPAIVYPWMNQQRLRGIKNVLIPSVNGKTKLEDIERALKNENVKVLSLSSVEFLGFRNDLAEIRKICDRYKCLLLVDAIQSIGACPVDVQEFKPDFLAAGSQKWMMSPSGIGFAYISKEKRDEIAPTYIGTTSIKYDFENFLDYKLDFTEDGSAYENSTLNCLGMIGLEASIELFLKLGVHNIFSHIISLQDLFINEMQNSEFVIESDLTPVNRSNILIFSHQKRELNPVIQKQLSDENIVIALREGFLRLSPHLFNNDMDIIKLTSTLKTLRL